MELEFVISLCSFDNPKITATYCKPGIIITSDNQRFEAPFIQMYGGREKIKQDLIKMVDFYFDEIEKDVKNGLVSIPSSDSRIHEQ